ncbi:MAG: aspartyl protease family protein [Myxococcota bacterium]
MALPGALLGAALLLLPALAAASEPPSGAVLADVPFTGAERNRVIVDLAPEGSSRPFPLFLDTGASDSVLTPRMARDLGVRVRRIKRTPYRKPTLLGRDLQFWVDTRSSDTGSKTGWEYGLLGGRFLAEYVVEIDFPGRRVRFLDRKKYRVPERADAPDEAVLPLRVVSNRPIVEIELEGRPVRVLLDTGAPGTLILSGKAAKEIDFSWEPLARIEGGSVLGPVDLELAEARDLRLGPFGFGTPVSILIAPRGFYNQGTSTDSVVGYDLLSQFVVRIDYPRKRLWLRRDAEVPLTLSGAE